MTSKSQGYVDFRKVKEEVNITDLLAHYGVWDAFKGSGTQRRGPCPICDSTAKRKFNVNLRKNVWYCFGDCKAGGNVIDLVVAMERCSAREAGLKLAKWFDIDAPVDVKTNQKANGESPAEKRSKKKSAKTDESDPCVEGSAANQPLTFERLKHLNHDHEALIARGLLSDTAEHFGVGYATKGIMRGCIAIPLHDLEGRLLAYAGVDPEDPEAPYRWPQGFRPELEVYNAHRAASAKRVKEFGLIVVPDFFDVFELFEAGIARVVMLPGDAPSNAQRATLRSLIEGTRDQRITYAYTRDRLDDEPPYDLMGRLASLAMLRVVSLQTLIKRRKS